MGFYWLSNSSEFLAFLCLAGIFSALIRWPKARRRDLLLAFAIFLGGTFLREWVVYWFSPTDWPEEALILSAAARILQIVGAALFVRGALLSKCGEWGWIAVVLAAFLFAGVV